MATIKQRANGTFQLTVKSKLLPRPLYATFDAYEPAKNYATQLEGLLAQGIVPTSLLERTKTGQQTWTISRCIAEYLRHNSVPVSDIKLLDTIRSTLTDVRSNQLNYDWADSWIRELKRERNLSPSTIRHRHGALARCLDWMIRKHPGTMAQNPLRLLKRGFATYTDDDKRHAVVTGRKSKVDVERNRRLDSDEEKRILQILKSMPEEKTIFILALETSMRMRECYTLAIDQVGLKTKTIHLDRTKNGDSRQIPLSSPVIKLLAEYMKKYAKTIKERDGRLFSFWNGDRNEYALDSTTSELSRTFRKFFREAEVVDFRFHDVRHEATCRLYEKTKLSDVLIARITGHRSLRMQQRYASLRGSDLAAHLW